MSARNTDQTVTAKGGIEGHADDQVGAGQDGAQTTGTGNKPPTLEEELSALNLRVTCFDGIRKMLYSKAEWEAYLLERIKKEEKKS